MRADLTTSAMDADRGRSRGSEAPGVLLVAALLAGGLFFAGIVGGTVGALGLAVVAFGLALFRFPRDAVDRQGLLVALGACSPWLVWCAGAGLDPLFEVGFYFGLERAAMVWLAPPVVAFLAALLMWVYRRASASAQGRVGRAIAALAGLSAVASVALLSLAVVRGQARPTPKGYLASLPTIGVVPPAKETCAPVRRPEGSHSCDSPPFTVGPVTARLSCDDPKPEWRQQRTDRAPRGQAGLCRLSLSTDAESARRQGTEALVPDDAPVEIRHDEVHGLWFLAAEGRPLRAMRDDGSLLFYVRPSDVKGSVAPPGDFSWIAAAGLLMALTLGVLAEKSLRAAEDLASAREGVLDSGGWVAFGDGSSPVHVLVPAIPPGPVTVVSAPVPAGYRSAPSAGAREATRVLIGPPAEHVARSRGNAVAHHTAVLAILLATAAPLVAAAAWALL